MLEIEKILDIGLPKNYTLKEYQQKCQEVFQHFYDNYYGDGQSVYNLARNSTNGPTAR